MDCGAGGGNGSTHDLISQFRASGLVDGKSVAAGYRDHLSGVTAQAIGALLDAAGVGRGTRGGPDVATGAGYAAAAAAERGAVAVGVDFSATQLTLARREYPAIEFREGDASALPFPDRNFDAVVSNFGMPHFPDPDAFLGGRCVCSEGRPHLLQRLASPQESIGFGIIYGAAQAHGRMDVPLPPGPNFFLFSDPAQCERSLHAAGFRLATVTKVPQIWRVTSPDAHFEAIMKGTVRAAALLRAQTPEAPASIRDALQTAAGAYARDGALELMMPAVVAAAERPWKRQAGGREYRPAPSYLPVAILTVARHRICKTINLYGLDTGRSSGR